MNKTIYYKSHTIILDGITAKLHYQGELIFKRRFTNAFECVQSLKSFINLRTNQLRKEKSINLYV